MRVKVDTIARTSTMDSSIFRRRLINSRRYTKKRFYSLIKAYSSNSLTENGEAKAIAMCLQYVHKQQLDNFISYDDYNDFIVSDIMETLDCLENILLFKSRARASNITRFERNTRIKKAEIYLQRKQFFKGLNY